VDVASASLAWDAAWPGCRPVGHELKSSMGDRWVRFHSLPESKRYPQTNDEYSEMLRRHNMVLAELRQSSPDSAPLLLVTCSWSGSSDPTPRDWGIAHLIPHGTYWRSYDLATEEGFSSWIHLYLNEVRVEPSSLDQVFRDVAQDGTSEVIVAPKDMSWLYHPYDGGADVIATSIDERDRLRAAHPSWLSNRPDGL